MRRPRVGEQLGRGLRNCGATTRAPPLPTEAVVVETSAPRHRPEAPRYLYEVAQNAPEAPRHVAEAPDFARTVPRHHCVEGDCLFMAVDCLPAVSQCHAVLTHFQSEALHCLHFHDRYLREAVDCLRF